MKEIKIKFIFVLLLLLSFGLQAKAGSEGNIFVPNQYSPLSSYVLKTSTSTQTLSFNVKPEVVQYVINGNYPGYIAWENSATKVVTLLTPSSYNADSGIITLITSEPGKYVVVAEPFTNDFPIVTHWYQGLNNGKGGYQLGAADEINKIDFNPEQFVQYPEYKGIQTKFDMYDADLESPYQWNTAKYAFFGDPSIRVPSYERYVGENYSVFKITDLLAVSISLQSVERNGYPVLHRNYPYALHAGAPLNQQVKENIPAIQFVHSVVLEAEAGKPSLSTYVLPPMWNKTPAVPYPIVFNGHYDINMSSALGSGPDFVKVIGDLKKDNIGSAIGVIWNGGAGFAGHTWQQSSYLNAAYTMYVAQVLFGANPMKVVTTGISRGAATGITVAANPYFSNYKVQYVLAYSPPVALGEHLYDWYSPNYAQNYMSTAWSTGYKYSYKESFVDSFTGMTGNQLFLYNNFGTTNPAYADSVTPLSDVFVNNLKNRGTNVMISIGFNDPAIPTHMQLQLVKKYKSAGIPTETHIGHRFGHNYFTDTNAQLYWAMKENMLGTNTTYDNSIHHYRRQTETGVGEKIPVKFTPERFISANFPKLAWRGKKIRMELTGSAGQMYAVAYYKIDDAQWLNNHVPAITGPQNVVAINSLNDSDLIQSQYFDHTFPTNLTPGYYIALVATSTDQGATWNLVDPTHVPQPFDDSQAYKRLSVFEIQEAEPSIPALNINSDYTLGDRGWGLSTY